jgi:4-oxalocrotonate tautomerase
MWGIRVSTIGPWRIAARELLNTHPSHTFQRYTMPIIILKQRKGLSLEQKRRIVREFTETMVRTTGVKKELVTILIEELSLEDIGKAGKLRSDE